MVIELAHLWGVFILGGVTVLAGFAVLTWSNFGLWNSANVLCNALDTSASLVSATSLQAQQILLNSDKYVAPEMQDAFHEELLLLNKSAAKMRLLGEFKIADAIYKLQHTLTRTLNYRIQHPDGFNGAIAAKFRIVIERRKAYVLDLISDRYQSAIMEL